VSAVFLACLLDEDLDPGLANLLDAAGLGWRVTSVRAEGWLGVKMSGEAPRGEPAQPPWWRNQVSTEVSGRWLERLFPRTASRAALEIGSRAALAVHHARGGRLGHSERRPAH
jgi:hypothetical protein